MSAHTYDKVRLETVTYPSDLYHHHGLATGVSSFDAITDEHLTAFDRQGYLVVQNAFTPGDAQNALDALLFLASGGNAAFKGIQFEKTAQGIPVDELPAEKKQDYVRKFMYFTEYDRRLRTLADHPELMRVLTRIMGETPALFQDMALLKPPRIGREKPWHQDHAYFELPLNALVVGVWIALDKATPENGCMIINPGSHRDGPVVHFQRRDWQICDTHVDNQTALAVPLKPGGCLLFHSLLHHGTANNLSDQRRRALQVHYRPASVQPTGVEERLAVFGEEGKDVTC